MDLKKSAKRLLGEIERLVKSSESSDYNVQFDITGLSYDEQEIILMLCKALSNYRLAAEYNLMKYTLTSDALGIAHWDMDVVSGDPINPDNKFTWSREFRQMIGFSGEDDFPNILSSWSNRLHPDDKERTLNAFNAHIVDLTGKTPYDLEYRLMLKNGEYRHFRAFGTTMRDSNGIPLRVAGALQDITDKKQMEAKLAEEHVRAEETAHWYKSILDATPLPITVTDADMKWTFVNKAVETFLGTKREDMMGLPCSNWNAHICNTDDCGVACAKRGLKHTFFSHQGASYQVDVEILKDMKGETAGFIEVVQDITKVETMARQQADAANEAKSQFLAYMSHEIRTPLNAVIGMTAIGKNTTDIERKDYALNKIGDASSHLLGVVNDVLDMAKIEANKMELSPVEFIFEKMLQKVLTVVNFRLEEKRQRFSVNVDSRVPCFIIGDDQRLAQVITNLLSNAIKFTPEEGKVSLDVSLVKEEDGICELRVEVADSGIGMSPEQQKKLFSAFEQAESGTSRKYGGTGLGLAISKRIVELMDGTIWAVSELGKGARFIFTIKVPRGQKTIQSLSADDSSQDKLNTGKDEFAGKRLLLAEDVEINREIIISLLEDTGLIIDTAVNGREVVDMVQAAPDKYDLIFMDLQMPEMDGLEATRLLRSQSADRRIPIIAMTANVFKDDIDKCLAAGMDAHIGKPIDINDVLEKLREYLS
ncbi:MAG: response regulator [Treponema sp.]|jgi:PAS domain S-box-containing protein|nr:response regulator [Treponema sp.]